jgi:hypothetical protein
MHEAAGIHTTTYCIPCGVKSCSEVPGGTDREPEMLCYAFDEAAISRKRAEAIAECAALHRDLFREKFSAPGSLP